MHLSIVIIGDEILLGQVTDTNSGFISRSLAPLGFTTDNVSVVPDSEEKIESAIKQALKCSDLVITTGGLGPTKDDITKTVLSRLFGGKMYRNSEVTKNIERIFLNKGLKINSLTLDQALVPDSCTVIQNRYGTAPVMWFQDECEGNKKVCISLPGVPFETESILNEGILKDKIIKTFSTNTYYKHETITVSNISESSLAILLENFEDKLAPNFHLAYLPENGLIYLRLDGKGDNLKQLEIEFSNYFENLKTEVKKYTVFEGKASHAEILLSTLRDKNLTLSTAESCTGGNIAHLITEIPGCSDVFKGGIVCYSNEIKSKLLNVTDNTLLKYGAVSEEVVKEMALGALKKTNTSAVIATSGIAGPSGGSKEKPVGTVWTAVAYINPLNNIPIVVSECQHIRSTNRRHIINQASLKALLMLNNLILKQ